LDLFYKIINLRALTKREKKLLKLLTVIIVLYIFCTLFYPKANIALHKAKQIREVKSKIKNDNELLQRWNEQEVFQLRREIDNFQEDIQETVSFSEFMVDIEMLSEKYGDTLLQIKHEMSDEIKSDETAEELKVLPVELTFRGSYNSLMQLLLQLENYSKWIDIYRLELKDLCLEQEDINDIDHLDLWSMSLGINIKYFNGLM
jgi:hypothetical protein